MRPLFRHDERAVDETFGQIEMAALFEILGERFEHPLERAVVHPTLEAAVAGLVWRISLGQIRPLRSRAQDPEDAVQHLATAAPGPPASVRSSWHLTNERRYDVPLFVGDVHCCILLEDTAYHPFMRWLVVTSLHLQERLPPIQQRMGVFDWSM